MDKMIGIINHNLEAIISGIKTHKERTEKTLKTIESEIKNKNKIAKKYESQITDTKEVIANLDNDISDLENDLAELNDKFGSKDFIEILSVGNKEIKGKIDEKKSQINEENSKIVDLNKKIEEIKLLLDNMNKKRETVVNSLNDIKILEKYYCERIEQIIKFADDHKEDLRNYVEDDILKVDISDVEEEQLLKVVDDSVFKEIDDYTSIISSVNDVINKSNNITEKANELSDEIHIYNSEAKEEQPSETSNQNNQYNVIDLFINEEDYETKNPDQEDLYAYNEINNAPNNDEESVFKQISDMVFDKKNIVDTLPENEINLVQIQNAFIENEVPLSVELDQCGLNYDLFEIEDKIKLQNCFNKQNTIEFIQAMIKHKININLIYKSVDVLTSITPQTLDEILTILDKANYKASSIEYIFKYLDNININKLEKNINDNIIKSLPELLYESRANEPNEIINFYIDLSSSELRALRKNTTPTEYGIINMLPDMVLCNYNTIKSLNTNNLNECFTKYPHRFTLIPDEFNEILDKYDLDDLIRCINKNAGVIDKL